MNAIFLSLIVASIVSLLFTGPQKVLIGLNDGASKALSFSLYMLPIYAIWLGILELMEKSKLTEKLAKLLKPFIRFLFGKQDETTENLLAQNIAGNLIGVGGVATPSGIEACTLMQKENVQVVPQVAMLILLNSSSLQIVPTTLLSLRQTYGSTNPSNILAPCLITSLLTTIFAVFMAKFFEKIKQKRSKR